VALTKDRLWHGGISAGYESTIQSSASGRTKTRGDRVHLGIVAKYQWGATLISAGASGGMGWFDSTRTIAFPGFAGTARGHFTQGFVTGRLRVGHLFPLGAGRRGLYLKPQLDLDLSWVRRSGFTETGAGAANLTVQAQSDVTFSASPTLEIGGQFRLHDQVVLRPYVRAGLTVFSRTRNSLTGGFAAATGAFQPFTVTSRFDRVHGTMAAGALVFLSDPGKRGLPGEMSLRIEYDGRFSANARQHGIHAKFALKF
jgi:outer membrane autotransporter protein